MIQLFSITWGILNVHLLLTLDNPSEDITFRELNKFLTLQFLKFAVFGLLSLFTMFEATGFLLCYAYLDFNIAISTVFWTSVIISSITILLVYIVFILEFNDLKNDVKEPKAETSPEEKSNIFSLLMRLNLIFAIILSVLLFRFFIRPFVF